MYLSSVDDLRTDALFRAGEPQDSSSSFWTKSIEYLNRIQRTLLMGGGVAVGRDLATSAGIYAHLVDLPITDWWWARKRGLVTTEPRLQFTTSGAVAVGASSVTFTTPTTKNLAGYCMKVPGVPTIMRFVDNTPGASTVSFDGTWAEEAEIGSGTTVDVFRLEYDLPADFLRFATPPYAHVFSGRSLSVSSSEQRNTEYPLALISTGQPTSAYMAGMTRLGFNTYDTRPYRLEFEYVSMLPDLVSGGVVQGIPAHHVQVIASGAAMLMTFDKGDSRQDNLASEYRELVRRMGQEHRRLLSGGSSTFGVFKVRDTAFRTRAPQPFGELYLI